MLILKTYLISKCNSELCFCILKINIWIQKVINWVQKWTFQFWISLFESKSWYFNFEIFNLNSEDLFDLKVDILVLIFFCNLN